MNNLNLTYEDVRTASEMLRRYARGVETHLYMNMKTDHAFHEISEAYRLADELDELADKMDTVSPADLG